MGPTAHKGTGPEFGRLADRLNRTCLCLTLDRAALCAALEREADDTAFCQDLIRNRPHLFSNVPVFLSPASIGDMSRVVAAIETVAQRHAYREAVLSWAPEIARIDHGPAGALMGYDFHLDEAGAHLIEVNTNAGGAFLNALLARAQRACCAEIEPAVSAAGAEHLEADVLAMFREEWRRQRGDCPLRTIAIVDDDPEEQYLYPEFVLARQMLVRAGILTSILDPRRLSYAEGQLRADDRPIDLVYNRLTDFALDHPDHAALAEAYRDGAVVMTPNPHNHALLADKRNLTLLSDPALHEQWDLPPELRAELALIPRTRMVTADNADVMWSARKSLFFKPASGHGGKAVYRGDKVTRGVWADIISGGYVAQDFAAPGERMIEVDGAAVPRKMDVRLYTYAGRVLLCAARLYQGQTTNFRTPGGGFAPVLTV